MPTSGGGAITLIPNGSDTVGSPSILLQSNSCSFISDGISKWVSLGFGLNTVPLSFSNVTVALAAGSNSSPPLSFFNDSTSSLGIFYNSSASAPYTNESMQIVQSYFNPSQVPVVIADFYSSVDEPLGFVTLAENSTFSGTIASIFGSTFDASTATLLGSTFSEDAVNINAIGDIDLTSISGDINIESLSGYVDISADLTMTLGAGVLNIESPRIQEYTISIYSLARAYL
jgi:hypothetical protein